MSDPQISLSFEPIAKASAPAPVPSAPILHQDWQLILKNAWSIRFMGIALVFTIIDKMIDSVTWLEVPFIPHWMFGMLGGVAMFASFISRLMVQRVFQK